MGFLVEKDKLKWREFLMPDIARVTPYTLEECVERLAQYTSKQKLYRQVELNIAQDEDDPDVRHFTIWENFMVTGFQSGMRGSASLQITGVLMRWKGGESTKVRAVVKTSPSFYVIGTAFVLICAVLLAVFSSLPAVIHLLFILFVMAFAAFIIYQNLGSVRTAKRMFLDEIKEVLHKEDGSIE